MGKSLLLLLVILSCFQIATAQKASDVLENGIPVKRGEKIFLQYDNHVLKFDVAKSLQDVANPPDFTTLGDSVIFLVFKNGVNVYLKPLNPLNYSYTTEIKEITDPINEAASDALGSIIDLLGKTESQIGKAQAPGFTTSADFDTCPGFYGIIVNLKSIQDSLKNNQKDKIVKAFTLLNKMTFSDESCTILQIDTVAQWMAQMEKHFAATDSAIERTKTEIEAYDCDSKYTFIIQYILQDILNDLSNTSEEQKKRYGNLQIAFKLVKNAQENSSTGGGEIGLKWCRKLDEVPSKEGKISLYTVAIREAGYKLSEGDEIIGFETDEAFKRTLRIRKFQRFVPELSVGTAYTTFKYYSYGTTSDSTGQQLVAAPTENLVHNLNITTMINWNYYLSNSNIHPFYQLGIGINSGMPTLLTGLGIRSNVNGLKRFAISGGLAMTWIKELDKLKEGDTITGTDDIDKDLKYQFSWPPKPYIGLQYNF